MFAARDQENLVHGHQQVAASKPLNQGTRGLQPRTPGNKYPKTPLRVPLNDENAIGGFGRSVMGKGVENLIPGGKKTDYDKNSFVTPMGPRVRAPLGAKTTNAKAKTIQTPAGPTLGKPTENTQPPASTRRPKRVTYPEAVKIEVHVEDSPLRADRDVEYCPPKVKDLPYESDDFPSGCLNYEPLKGANLTKGIYQAYHLNLDTDGLSETERRLEEEYKIRAEKADADILKSLEEDWVVGDVPETFAQHQNKQSNQALESKPLKRITTVEVKPPGTITSRKAVTALSAQSKPAAPVRTAKPKSALPFLSRSKAVEPVVSSHITEMRHTAAIATSRSTIGYNKGRSASGVVQTGKRQGGMTRSISNLSQSSDVTITPARFAQKEELESKRLTWLSAFDAEDVDLEPGLRGGIPDCLRRTDVEEEDYIFTLGDEV